MPVTHERGYLIPAIGTQYVECAYQLADSIKQFHPTANITVLTEEMLPYGNKGGYANDWQCFAASPYRETIKLEADMIATGPIDHWWALFETRDVVVSQGCRTLYNKQSNNRYYRKIFDANDLPDVYNAITYWRLSKTAQDFFNLVQLIFENWKEYRTLLKFPDNEATTDVVYAMAVKILGVDLHTLPGRLGPQIVHMKKYHQPIQGNDWTKELVWETDPFRINTVAQSGFVHYHVKDWRAC